MRWIDLAHRWAGGTLGLLLALLGLSGAAILHVNLWTMVAHKSDPPVQDTARIAGTVTRLMADPSHRPQMIAFASPGFGVDRLVYGHGAGAYADQAGSVLVRWHSQWARPELWLADLHKHLLMGETGETIVGIAGIAGVLFVVSGTVLWWRTRRTFDFRLWPKRLSRPAILRHHRDLGIVMAPLLLLSLVTGYVMVFRPLASVVLGPGAASAVAHAAMPPRGQPGPIAANLDWSAMIVQARQRFPDAEFRSVALPRGGNGLIVIRMRQPWEWLPNGRTVLWFAARDGALVEARDPARSPMQVRAYNLLYPLHAGKVGGLAYRLVMTLSGLTLGLLGTLAVWSFWFGRRPAPPRRP